MKINQQFNHQPVLLGLALGLVVFGAAQPAYCQTADEFNPGASSYVYALAVQADGNILVGGNFTQLGGRSRSRIGRLNADGTLDANFNPVASSAVCCLAVQDDGNVVVGGNFSLLGGKSHSHIGRLNADGTVDTSFIATANNAVYSLALQPDGEILVGGAFITLGGQSHSRIGRLNADGTVDTDFAAVANGTVYSLALQPDGKILVGGAFSTLGGKSHSRIGRLNTDGTVDTNFNANANSTVYSLALQADGKILVGGDFSSLGGKSHSRIGRLNTDGTADTNFNASANSTVYSLALQADGSILAGGAFITLGGKSHSRIGRLNADGTADTNFNASANSTVYSLALQADGSVLAGGNFSTLGGQSRSRIGRLYNTELATQALTFDGSAITWQRGATSPEVWRTTFQHWTSGTWEYLGEGVRTADGWEMTDLDLPADATIGARGYVAGGQYNGSAWFVETTTGALAVFSQPASRTNNAGTTAYFSVYAGGTGPLGYQWCKDGTNLLDGDTLSGAGAATLILSNVLATDIGDYSVIVTNDTGSITSLLAHLTVIDPAITSQPLNTDGNMGEDVTFSVSATGTPPLTYQWRKNGLDRAGETSSSLALTNIQFADSGNYDVIVSNSFGSITSRVAVLRVNLALPDVFDPASDGWVYTIALQPDGKILAGGSFSILGKQVRANLARLNPDGAVDTNYNSSTDGPINALVVQPDGKILVGGQFTLLNGQSRTNLGRLNADATVDLGFDPAAEGPVACLALQADGKILVGGGFNQLGGASHTNLGRLNADGTVDAAFNAGANGWVSSIAIQRDAGILVGGSFSTLGGQSRYAIGRLDPNGSTDPSFDAHVPDGNVSSLVVQPDGRILVGGQFSFMGGQYVTNLARLNPADGTADNSFNPGTDVYTSVNSLALQADGSIVVAGQFTVLGGQARANIGRLNADGTLDATFNPGADDAVQSLAIQRDGNILVAGNFTTLAGQSRNYIGRLINTAPATETLTFNGSSLTWLRGGTGPEVWRTTFDYSINGNDWFTLGNGSRIPGGWQLSGVAIPSDASIRAQGYITGGQYNGSSWLIENMIGRPGISLPSYQPASRTNNAGTAAAFSVYAGGTGPFGYQWCKDGTNLFDGGKVSGASAITLILSNVLGADAGAYSVIITNATGSITSLLAHLTVIDPAIITQPLSTSGNIGEDVTFSVSADGTQPLSYQWRKDGTDLLNAGRVSEANSTSLVISNVQWSDAGDYSVVVTNAYGSVTSSVVALQVVGPTIVPGSIGMTNGYFWFQVTSATGALLEVQASTNLTYWETIGVLTNSSGLTWFLDPSTNLAHRFYRLNQ